MVWKWLTDNLKTLALVALGGIILALALSNFNLQRKVRAKDTALERAAVQLTIAARNLEICAGNIARQNMAIQDLSNRGAAAQRIQEMALEEARRVGDRADTDIRSIQSRQVTGCRTGDEILNADL